MFPRIRSMILKIPPGKVSTYGAIARAAGYPGAARQVVWALRQSHGLPWHRVVAAGGRIALQGESGLEQRFRLEAEGVRFSGRRVRLADHEFQFPGIRMRKKKKIGTRLFAQYLIKSNPDCPVYRVTVTGALNVAPDASHPWTTIRCVPVANPREMFTLLLEFLYLSTPSRYTCVARIG